MQPDIVACARGWIGTRFHHQGRIRKTATHRGGVDCLGLLVGVADELGLRELALADETSYSHQPDAKRLKVRLSELLCPLPISQLASGNVALFCIDEQPQHLGIISDYQGISGIIHAYAPARAVVEHRLDAWWWERIDAVFSIPKI